MFAAQRTFIDAVTLSALTEGRAIGKSEPLSFLNIKDERGTVSQRPTQKLKPKRLVLEGPVKKCMSVQQRASLFPGLGTGVPELGGHSTGAMHATGAHMLFYIKHRSRNGSRNHKGTLFLPVSLEFSLPFHPAPPQITPLSPSVPSVRWNY